MKYIKLILLFSFLISGSQCQNIIHPYKYGGTIVISALCKDGIVVCADSRTVMINDKNEVIGYYDETEKLYRIDDYIFSMAGIASFDNIPLSGLVQNFQNSLRQKLPIDKLYEYFMKYAKSKISKDSYSELNGNKCIICGYSENKPLMYLYEGNKIKVDSTPGDFMISSDLEFGKAPKFPEIKSSSTDEMGEILDNYLKRRESQPSKITGLFCSYIGYPNSIVSISGNYVRWIKDDNKNEYFDIKSLITAINNGDVKITYRSKSDSIESMNRSREMLRYLNTKK